ncbi:DUF342 domain-containing protein [Glaciecola petra]|uniref:FapA family protein n=1 Tax=Glaciecola petra TaxID=3075602 RepID=A0ABU2ZNJ5_9ALTE|nr:FapA family protein [Aestuariibacter sp. P117]MDT0594193.1 FapA family protein [Aestuariibacter sp. P117]
MNGIHLYTSTEDNKLSLSIEPLLIEDNFEVKALIAHIGKSEYSNYYLDDENILELCDTLKEQLTQDRMEPIEGIIGQKFNAKLNVVLSDDKMEAELQITSAYGGENPNVTTAMAFLSHHSIVRGVSRKRIDALIKTLTNAPPGTLHKATIAKGLPPKTGKGSIVRPVVPNALDRALTPSQSEGIKVDMRDFGDIICVVKDQLVAERIPPKKGRNGYTVTGEPVPAQDGDWHKIKIGTNVYISIEDENQVFASIDGLPKFSRQRISVDDVFVTKGVNVATGNIKYGGAVIVNGDITEKMKIEADGDVTINGFVESAYIKSSGDIIITQGATGKIQEKDCCLIAKGSVFLQHGQGLDITADKNINIMTQLAHSVLHCGEDLIVGEVKQPLGKIFASYIYATKKVMAGTLGAISGSDLIIDYAKPHIAMSEKLKSMNTMYEDLLVKNTEHEKKLENVHKLNLKDENAVKKRELIKELELERVFLNWLRVSIVELKTQLKTFKQDISIVANKGIFPGVKVQIDDNQWKSENELSRCRIVYEYSKWKKLLV